MIQLPSKIEGFADVKSVDMYLPVTVVGIDGDKFIVAARTGWGWLPAQVEDVDDAEYARGYAPELRPECVPDITRRALGLN